MGVGLMDWPEGVGGACRGVVCRRVGLLRDWGRG
jgi:hypothetical protein